MKVHFLYLTAFCVTGGIEKFNKAFIKALSDIAAGQNYDLNISSAYDKEPDEKYLSRKLFKGFNKKRLRFVISSVVEARKSDVIFLGHINLAPLGLLLKIFNPKGKLFLITHGTEVWEKLSFIKGLLLKSCFRILAVSSYTKKKIEETHKIHPGKIIVFYNAIDPYFQIPVKFEKPAYLMKSYGIDKETKVILTVARIRYSEGYKGYDRIIRILPSIVQKHPNTKYILAGSYDYEEKKRIDLIIKENSAAGYVLMPGFIKDEELKDHYLIADTFVMPSKGEGFGIVYIEAMACGLPVIAGNKDGSVDALKNGELGTLINPDNDDEIKNAIIKSLNCKADKNLLQGKVVEEFGFEKYKGRLKGILEREGL